MRGVGVNRSAERTLGSVAAGGRASGLSELSGCPLSGPDGLGGSSLDVTAGSLPLPVGLAFDDEFVGGRGEPVHGGLGQERIGHHGQPLVGLTVGRDHDRRLVVLLDHQLVAMPSAA